MKNKIGTAGSLKVATLSALSLAAFAAIIATSIVLIGIIADGSSAQDADAESEDAKAERFVEQAERRASDKSERFPTIYFDELAEENPDIANCVTDTASEVLGIDADSADLVMMATVSKKNGRSATVSDGEITVTLTEELSDEYAAKLKACVTEVCSSSSDEKCTRINERQDKAVTPDSESDKRRARRSAGALASSRA